MQCFDTFCQTVKCCVEGGAKMRMATLLLAATLLLSSCGAVIAYRRMQIMNDQQALLDDYKKCVEAGRADSDCQKYLAGAGTNVNMYGGSSVSHEYVTVHQQP